MNKKVADIIWQARLEAEHNWLKANQTLKEAFQLYPKEKKLADEIGNLYFKQQIFEEAVKFYEKAYVFDRKDVDIVFKLAYCHLINRDFDKAIYYFDKLPSIPEATYNKCVALYKLEKGFEAINLLEKLTETSSYSVKPYILLGKLYLEYERYDKIIILVEKTEKLFGTVSDLLFIRGSVYFQIRQWMKAYLDFSKAETIVETNPLYLRMFALVCEKIGLTEKAITVLQKCIDKYPHIYGAYYDLVKIYLLHNRYSDSLKVVDRLYKMGITLSEMDDSEGKLFQQVFDQFSQEK